MTCQDYRALLTDYVHNELDAAEDAAVFDHLQSCDACRAEWQAEVELTSAIRGALGAELDYPLAVSAGVRQLIAAQAPPTLVERLRASLRPAILAPAAAAVIAFVAVWHYDLTKTEAGPGISSQYFVRQHVVQTIGSPSSDRAWAAYLLTSANAESASDASPSD